MFFALCVWYKFLQSNYTSCFIFQLIYFTFYYFTFLASLGLSRRSLNLIRGGGGGQTWSHYHLIHINTSYSYSQNLHRFIIHYSVASTLFNFQIMHCSPSFSQYCLLMARGDDRNCLRWSWPTDYWSSCSSSKYSLDNYCLYIVSKS